MDSLRAKTTDGGMLSRLVPGWAREGIDIYSAAQGVVLDLFSLQNASMLNAVRRGASAKDMAPAGNAGSEILRGVVEAQQILLKLARRQNGVVSAALSGVLPAAAGVFETFGAGIDTFISGQQELLALAERLTLADRESNSAHEVETREDSGETSTSAVRQAIAALRDARTELTRVLRSQVRAAMGTARRTVDVALPAVEAADLWTAAEYILLHATAVYFGIGVPRGDNSAVLLIPGFLSGDVYFLELYAWLRRIGYRPYFSGIGLNAECPDLLVKHRLNRTIDRAREETGRRVHIIGHSLGGVIARSIACQRPEDVASVITLGAPLRHGGILHSRVLQAAEVVRRRILLEHGPRVLEQCYTGHCACDFVRCVSRGLPGRIVQTAVYTRHDTIVDWRYCRTEDPSIDVEVSGTHAGLVFNPLVYETIGSRLAPRSGTPARSQKTQDSHQFSSDDT